MALVSIEPQTGHVRALIGGRDFSQDQTNLALGGCQTPPPGVTVLVTASCQQAAVPEGGGTGRQPGSSFKPFVLATAFEHGVQPSEVIDGPPSIALPKGCTGSACTVIHNAEAAEGGVYTIAQAMWFSVNTVYAQLILDPASPSRRRRRRPRPWASRRRGTRRRSTGPATRSARWTSRPSTWPRPTGCSTTTASASRPRRSSGSRTPAGKTIIDDSRPTGTSVLSPTVADNVTNVLTGVISQPGATAYGTANIGTAGGRQDRDHVELRRRLVRRLHPYPRHVGLDGKEEHGGPGQRGQPR